MDRGVRVCARGHLSKATGSRNVFALDATDLERHPVFEKMSLVQLLTDTDTEPPTDRWSTVTN